MSDVMNDISGEEARVLALQFLGMNLGEMKELDKNIVSGLKPVAGSINPHAMVNSIALNSPPPQPQAPTPVHITTPVGVAPAVIATAPGPVIIPSLASLNGTAGTPIVAAVPQLQETVNPDQLELNFNSSPYTESVFEKLNLIERKLNRIDDTQQEILTLIENLKKKSRVATATVTL
jgi:hypothetical protein